MKNYSGPALVYLTGLVFFVSVTVWVIERYWPSDDMNYRPNTNSTIAVKAIYSSSSSISSVGREHPLKLNMGSTQGRSREGPYFNRESNAYANYSDANLKEMAENGDIAAIKEVVYRLGKKFTAILRKKLSMIQIN